MLPALSIKTKMTVAISLLAAVLLSTLAYSANIFFQRQFKQMVSGQLRTMVLALADQVDDKLKSTHSELIWTAKTLSPEAVTHPEHFHRFIATRPDACATFDNGITLFSADGTLLAGCMIEPSMLGKNFAHRDYFQKTIQTRQPQISDPFLTVQSNHHPIVMFTAPVFGPKGELIAVMTGSLDLFKENFLGRLATVKLGRKGYLYMFNADRTLIMHPDRSRILKKDVPPGANRLFDRAINGFEETGPTVTSRKIPVISSFRKIKTTGWILAGNFPQDEALAPAHHAEQYLLMSLLAVGLMALFTVGVFMKYLTAPLVSCTAQIRAMTHAGGVRRRIEVATKDEIGTLAAAFNTLLDEVEEQKGEIKKQLDFSQMLIDSLPNPVFYKDAEGRYLGCNKAFEASTGYSKREMIGKSVFEIAPSELAAIYHRADLDLMEKRGLQSYESTMVDTDGISHDIVFFKTAYPGPDGSLGGLIGTMFDITDRKRAEAALQEQKDFAESLVQNSAVPTFVLDDKHRVLIWNRACEALTGVRAAQVIGGSEHWRVFYKEHRPTLADLILDGELATIPDYYLSYLPSGLIPEGVQAEGWFEDRLGNAHCVSINAAPIRDQQGRLMAVIQTLEDITSRKQAEEAHEMVRRQLQLILDAAGEGIYGLDLEGRVTFVNPAVTQLTGFTQDELLGRHQHSMIHHTRPDGSPHRVEDCPVYASFRDGERHHVPDDIFWRKDGTSFPVEYVSTPLVEAGEIVGSVVLFKDTSERKQAEEQVLKLSQAVMQSPVSVLITDATGNIEFVNPRFTEMCGYEPHEVMGQNPRFLKPGSTTSEMYRNLWNTIASGSIWSGELYNRHKDGGLGWIHATISPIRNAAGQISHYMAFMESMEERKRLEEQLRQAQKMEAVGQLAGGIAHDFNNILTVIMGFGQLLHNTIPVDEPKRGHMEQILNAADRAAHLTQSLLAFSRKQVMMMQQVELNELAQKHIGFLKRIIGEDVSLTCDFTIEPLMVLADSGQIEQILMNLATNARDAMPAGGELRICTRVAQIDQEFHRQHGYGLAGSYALITLSDTGCGMDAEVREKIFEPFFTTKAPGRGTGLGLSIVYGIVKQHGGYITIESQWGRGTTFGIYLPLVSSNQNEQEPPPRSMPQGGNETILVVEDDPAVRELADSVLQTFGYTVLLAEDGHQALEVYHANQDKVSLALLDLIMPRMNGRQLCDALKRENPRLKVLFQSGYTADLLHDKGILIEGVELIMKPVQPVELARKIREMLDRAA